MADPVDPRCEASEMAPSRVHLAEARQIAGELATIARTGLVLPGSIAERHMVCGRTNCACHAEPDRRHGPYYQWTRKVAKKTVGRFLSRDQRDDYERWIANDRRVHELVRRLEELGVTALEADPRSTRQR
jgi:hypothetical protein